MGKGITSLVAGALVVGTVGSAAFGDGIVVDLTGGSGASGFVNGALFQFDPIQSAGTGVFQPFVRIQMNGTEEGYNTSGRPLPFDEKGSGWTRDLQLSELLVVTLGQTQYYAFSLDINESNADVNQLLSLDEVKIFTSSVAGQTSTDLNSLGTIRYRLDSLSGTPNSDHRVVMNAANTHGSGQSDMTMLVPISGFAGASPDDYVVLYSQFGLNNRSTAGFEEWSAAVPEPGTAGLALLGAAAFLGRRRRRCA